MWSLPPPPNLVYKVQQLAMCGAWLATFPRGPHCKHLLIREV